LIDEKSNQLCVVHAPDKGSEDVPVVVVIEEGASVAEISEVRDLSVLCALGVDLVERAFRAGVSAELESVLTVKEHALVEDRADGVLDKSGRSTSAVVAAVKHLHASEIKHTDILADALGDLSIGIVAVGVVIAAGEFCSVRTVLVPPVDARDLSSKEDRGREDLGCDAEDVLTVLDELLSVPGKEELAVVGSIVVKAVAKEASVRGTGVPGSSVVGLGISPLGMTGLLSSSTEISKHVCIIALELANTAVGPALVGLISGITELRGRTETDRDAVDGGAEIVAELRDKGLHKVAIHLEGSAAVEEAQMVNAKGDVLLVDLALGVTIVDVGVAVANRMDKVGKRDVAGVSDIPTALVERHNNLELQADLLAQLGKILVGSEVVLLGAGLRKTPPHISHNTLDSSVLDLLEIPLELSNIMEALLVDKSERKHKIHRNGTRNKRQTEKESNSLVH